MPQKEYDLDSATVTVVKTFDGIAADQIPADFAITVKGDKATYELKDGTQPEGIALEKSADGLTWTWTIEDVAPGTYGVTEDGEEIEGFDVTSSGLEEEGVVIVSDSVLLTCERTPECSSKDFEIDFQPGVIFATAVNPNSGEKGVVIITDTKLSEKMEGIIVKFLEEECDLPNNFKFENTAFGNIQDDFAGGSAEILGHKFEYNATDGILSIENKSD